MLHKVNEVGYSPVFCDAESLEILKQSSLIVKIISLLSGCKNKVRISHAGMTKGNWNLSVFAGLFLLLQDYVSFVV